MGEFEGPHAADEDMLAVVHHTARQPDRVLHVLHPGHGTGPQVRTVHQAGIHLMLAVGIEDGTAPRIEQG